MSATDYLRRLGIGSRELREGHNTTLAQKVGVSAETLSRKIAKVKRDDPDLTNSQAAGKAAGILRSGRA